MQTNWTSKFDEEEVEDVEGANVLGGDDVEVNKNVVVNGFVVDVEENNKFDDAVVAVDDDEPPPTAGTIVGFDKSATHRLC